MCLIKVRKDHEEDDTPPPRVVIRPTSHGSPHHSHDFVVSRPKTPRTSTHSYQHNGRLSATLVQVSPVVVAAQYINGPENGSSHVKPDPNRVSIPRIIHAPAPPSAKHSRERIELVPIETYEISPRASRGSIRSRHSRAGSRHSRHGSRSREDIVIVERSRSRSNTRGSRDRDPERGSRQYLSTTPLVDADGVVTYVESARPAPALLEEPPRRRSHSITYETNPRFSRERIVVQEDGRRRETYRGSLAP